MLGIIVLVLICVVGWLLYKMKRPSNFPPGPPPQPIIGNLLQMPKDGHLYKAGFSRQYGPVIGVSVFSSFFVIVSGSADSVIAALRKEEFQSRPQFTSVKDVSYGKFLGIFFSNGEQWSSTRKFVVKNMRAFGKIIKENLITDEIDELITTIQDGSTVQATGLFGLSAVNVIWKIIANQRLDMKDAKARNFLDSMTQAFRMGNPSGGDLGTLCPPLRMLSPSYRFMYKAQMVLQQYIDDVIQEHLEVLDPQNALDLMDQYLIEVQHNRSNPKSLFTVEDLNMTCRDMFAAGAESTSNSVEFVLLYMVLYPEVQARLQQELDSVLGRGRRPALDDRAQLPYTMAVLNEVERVNMVVPTDVPHYCTKDTTFEGYFIPKDTLIAIDLWSLGHDPKYWDSPDQFKPERFLGPDGKYTKSPIFFPFGLGSRGCVGEVFARSIIFLFTTTFFEKFSIRVPEGEPRPSTEALPGFTTAPRPFNITITARYRT